MKIQVISDIHVDFHKDQGDEFLKKLNKDCDVLVVAGDVAGHLSKTERFLFRLCGEFKDVIYVLGNHEFYGHNRGLVLERMDNFEHTTPNLHWLENSHVMIGNQKFVGATLWFRDNPNSIHFENRMSDFSEIKGFKNWVYGVNEYTQKYFNDAVTNDSIVITHHVPTMEGTNPIYRTNALTNFFVCEMDKFIMEKQPKVWCYGHGHNNHDKMVDNTRIICNPYGYPNENRFFKWDNIIEV